MLDRRAGVIGPRLNLESVAGGLVQRSQSMVLSPIKVPNYLTCDSLPKQ